MNDSQNNDTVMENTAEYQVVRPFGSQKTDEVLKSTNESTQVSEENYYKKNNHWLRMVSVTLQTVTLLFVLGVVMVLGLLYLPSTGVRVGLFVFLLALMFAAVYGFLRERWKYLNWFLIVDGNEGKVVLQRPGSKKYFITPQDGRFLPMFGLSITNNTQKWYEQWIPFFNSSSTLTLDSESQTDNAFHDLRYTRHARMIFNIITTFNGRDRAIERNQSALQGEILQTLQEALEIQREQLAQQMQAVSLFVSLHEQLVGNRELLEELLNSTQPQDDV